VAPNRAVRQQSGRGRPWAAEGAAATDAGAQAGRQCQVIIAGHAFVQNLRRGHYELAAEEPLTAAWRSPSPSSRSQSDPKVCRAFSTPRVGATQQTPRQSGRGDDPRAMLATRLRPVGESLGRLVARIAGSGVAWAGEMRGELRWAHLLDRRRSLRRRILTWVPQCSIEHHLRLWLRLRSRNSQVQFAQRRSRWCLSERTSSVAA
jgi:hypothetical protein